MPQAKPSLRILSLPGCHLPRVAETIGPWLQNQWPDIAFEIQVDTALTVAPSQKPTLAILRYPLDQLVGWFDERCQTNPALDQPNQWVSHAMSGASVWHRFFRRWFIEAPLSSAVMDYNDLFQQPDSLIDKIASLIDGETSNVRKDALPRLSTPAWEWEQFRYFGPGFAVNLKGLFAGCPWVDPQHDRLNLTAAAGFPRIQSGDEPPNADTPIHDPDANKQVLRRFANTPTVVFTAGKVGSKTVFRQLATRLNTPLYDVHRILDPLPVDDPSMLDEHGQPNQQLLDMKAVKETIFEPKQPARYISPIREPMGRNISALFQFYDQWVQDFPAGLSPAETADHLIDLFLQRENHLDMLQWFQTHLTKVTGLDPVGKPFDHGRGYQWYTTDRAAVLIYRCEDADRVQAHAIEQFMGMKHLRFQRLHRTQDKPCAAVYDQFLQRFRPTQTMLDALYQHPVTQTFYTESEIEGFYRHWQTPAVVTQTQPLGTQPVPTTQQVG